MTYQLTNLTVVTGASSGIGAEIARRLAARKARLLLTGRDAGGLRAVADSLDPAAPAAELVTADLADPAGVDTLVAAIADRPVDLLVNDAGFATYGAHADLDPRAEAGVIAVNCTALVALTRAVLPGMLERRHGFVLNTASTIAFQPGPRAGHLRRVQGLRLVLQRSSGRGTSRHRRASGRDLPRSHRKRLPGRHGRAGGGDLSHLPTPRQRRARR